MKSGSTRNYKGGPKNNWRRTVANEVLRRTRGDEQRLPILYLAGPQDLDRQIFIQKGVPSENLIAIDRHKPNVDRVRAESQPAVQADALDALWSWPENRPVAAVLLDFCCGLEWANCGVFDVFQRKSLRNATVMVNFQRGRDPWSNGIRGVLSAAGLLTPMWHCADGQEPTKVADAESRASQFLMWHAVDMMSVSMTGREFQPVTERGAQGAVSYVPSEDEDSPQYVASVSRMVTGMNPKFFSYKSGPLTFDSVVFHHPLHLLSQDVGELHGLLSAEERVQVDAYRDQGVARRLSAMFAVRTKRAMATR